MARAGWEADPPERDVGDEQRQREQQDRRAQRLFGFAPIAAWIEGLDRVMDDAPTAGGCRPGQRGRPLGRRRRPGGQLCREGEGEPAAGVGDQRAVRAARAEGGGEQQRAGVDVGAEAGLVAPGRGLGERQ